MYLNKSVFVFIYLFLLLNLIFFIIIVYLKGEFWGYIGFFIHFLYQIIEPLAFISILTLILHKIRIFILFLPTFINILIDYFIKGTIITSDYICYEFLFGFSVCNILFSLVILQLIISFIYYIFSIFRKINSDKVDNVEVESGNHPKKSHSNMDSKDVWKQFNEK
ncbi:Uncharacterised protein [Aliarcobacter skirrowii]|uniref:Membrane protein n=1 Tax=Aliarcobacter skirrowii CCUG 10374 TaxID=1032239 RepID=A0AAD0SML9_9BACT|nr:putative membrane protein [Aliarcobacter skirrowii CCUG 10374]RXI25224.1 hypothetical protein CP959_08980 [Aliarcobacter skirrowii CCUG 10374]SUU96156.1 Uncharacterised protein [Aliarcobacter skirrowii]